MRQPTAARYRPDIDGLRAFAVLAVVAYHAFPSRAPSGFIGVDVFFVISGYLISRILCDDLVAGRFTFLNFYARRVRRLLPALTVVLAAAWALGALLLLGVDFKNLGKHIACGSAFVSNMLLWREAGYFDHAAELKPLLHLWSLAVEEQFYLAWPLLLALAWRRRWDLRAVAAAVFLGSFAFNLWGTTRYGSEVFYLLPARMWELMVGCGLALYERTPSGRKLPAAAASFAGAALAGAALLTIDGSRPYPGWWGLLPTSAAALLLRAGPDAWVNRRLLSAKPAVLIGKISYPLYLWHWVLFAFARIVGYGTPAASTRAALAALSGLLAWLTWRFVELPVQRAPSADLSDRAKETRFVAAGAAVVAATWLLGAGTWAARGLPWRYPAMEAVAAEFFWQLPPELDCSRRFGLPKDDYCVRTAGPPAVLLWGDSHANHLFPGLAAGGAGGPLAVAQVGKGNCPAADGVDRVIGGRSYGCAAAYERARALADGEFASARVIVLSSQIPWDLDAAPGAPSFWRAAAPDAAAKSSRASLLDGLSRTVSRLESQGRRVVFALDVPELGFDPVECDGARPFFPRARRRAVCSVSRAQVDAQQKDYRAFVAQLAALHPRLTVFDPLPAFCDASSCSAVRDGLPLYRDGSHLTVRGSRLIGRVLADRLAALAP